jgi:hypothetical protein
MPKESGKLEWHAPTTGDVVDVDELGALTSAVSPARRSRTHPRGARSRPAAGRPRGARGTRADEGRERDVSEGRLQKHRLAKPCTAQWSQSRFLET